MNKPALELFADSCAPEGGRVFGDVRAFEHAQHGLSFTIPGDPVGKERAKIARFGKYVKMYTPDKTLTYEQVVRFHALEVWEKMGIPLLDSVPITIVVDCFLSVPKSWSKKKQALALAGRVRPVTKPDWDNLGKIVSDALNQVIYRDDSAIWCATVIKRYDAYPRTQVTLTWTDA